MIASDLRQAYNQTKWALLLRGLLSLAVGIAILVRPMASVEALALVIALWSLFDGIVNIVRSFSLPDAVERGSITADYKDGVLLLHLPKRGEQQQKGRVKIDIG